MTRSKKNAVETYMPLVIEKYHGDTQHLTTLQHGAYLLLLMQYWRTGAALPADDDQLRAIAKMDRQEWKKAKPVLAAFFDVAGGRWKQKRAEEELAAARLKSAKAKASADTRWGNGCSEDANASREHDERIPKPMQNACLDDAPPSSIAVEANASPAEPPKASPPSPRRKASVPLPDDWLPNAKHQEKAESLGVSLSAEAEKMRNWAKSKDERSVDWDARFQNWLSNARSSNGTGQHGGSAPQSAAQRQRELQRRGAFESAMRGSG